MIRRTFLTGAAGATLISAVTASCARSGARLNVYNWSDYVAPDTIPNFEREFGVRVHYGTYESAPEMLAKVMSGNSGWDVVFPSAEFVQPMRDMGLLAPLRHDLLTNLGALDPLFQDPPWDRGLAWSVPYMHGTTGIVYRKGIVPEPKSWTDLWDARLRGRITMLDDPPEVFGACLKKIGCPLNSADPRELREAQAQAVAQKPLLRAYLNAEVRDQLVAGDVAAAQAWAVTAGQAIAAAPDKLAYRLPAEGFARYADTMAILRESRSNELAHRFIDYLLRPEVSAVIVGATQTATANRAALALLPAAMRENPVLYPPAAELARGEWFEPQSAASQKLRDRLWTEIKSS
jgi:spermidine/putrescine transport system substrate-binding protein